MIIQWSFSSLKQFINCPRQYYEVKVLQNYKQKESVQMIYGTEVHKALEEYVKNNAELPKNYQRFKPMVDAVAAIPGTKLTEYKMALDTDKKVCDFDDEKRWVRGIVDLLIVDGDRAFIVDYKTGSNRYPDPKQLTLMSLMTFTHFPEVKSISAALLFVAHNSLVPKEYTRDDQELMWHSFGQDLARLEIATRTNKWSKNPTPLCRWCPVVTCEFHKE